MIYCLMIFSEEIDDLGVMSVQWLQDCWFWFLWCLGRLIIPFAHTCTFIQAYFFLSNFFASFPEKEQVGFILLFDKGEGSLSVSGFLSYNKEFHSFKIGFLFCSNLSLIKYFIQILFFILLIHTYMLHYIILGFRTTWWHCYFKLASPLGISEIMSGPPGL